MERLDTLFAAALKNDRFPQFRWQRRHKRLYFVNVPRIKVVRSSKLSPILAKNAKHSQRSGLFKSFKGLIDTYTLQFSSLLLMIPMTMPIQMTKQATLQRVVGLNLTSSETLNRKDATGIPGRFTKNSAWSALLLNTQCIQFMNVYLIGK